MESSPEATYWSLAAEAAKHRITRPQMGKLAKLTSDYQRALSILSSALKTKKPSAYLGKVMANLKEEQAPPQIHIPRTHEPEIVLQARLHGWPVRKTVRGDGTPGWFVAGVLYDHTGMDVGA
jgi:hypothetical protein